jgi:hypothetical protein
MGTVDWHWFVGLARELCSDVEVEVKGWDAFEKVLGRWCYEANVLGTGAWEVWRGVSGAR